MSTNAVDHPRHYTSHPSGVETVEITEWLPFNLGNCVKYIMRREHKGNERQDLEKALWYARREKERQRDAFRCPIPAGLVERVTRVAAAEPDWEIARAIGLLSLSPWGDSFERDLSLAIRIIEEKLS